MKYGTLVRPGNLNRLDEIFAPLREMGFTACQLAYKPPVFLEEDARRIREAADHNGIEISAHFIGFNDGFESYNLRYSFLTNGLSAPTYRARRLDYLIEGIDFIRWLGITDMVIHAGFIPNNPFDPDYLGLLVCIQRLGTLAKAKGVNILFETGAESPVSLLRLIREADTGNLYVNLDTGNALMYGYGNPVDALTTYGAYVRNMHLKDGFPPADCDHLGPEAALGDGEVDFERLMAKLAALGYDRYMIIEREISGPQQRADVLRAKTYLESLLKKYPPR